MYTIFPYTVSSGHSGNLLVNLLSEEVCHERHPLETNDHAITTMFALYEQYTT